jgi:predicted phosphodiesterase
MRILIFSDLHANANALNTLNESYDELWFMGDIVGYGPDVHETIDFVMLSHTHTPMLRRLSQTIVLNPGSLRQLRDGDWRASYALWEDRVITFHRYPYDRPPTAEGEGYAPLSGAVCTASQPACCGPLNHCESVFRRGVR